MAITQKNTLSSTPDSFGDQQARWNKQNFDDFITDKGYNCFIDRAMSCPCRAKGNGSALSDCVNCQGTGWFFINRKSTKVLCSSISNRTKYAVWSRENVGTVNISSRAEDKMGFMDRIILTDLESWFSETLYLQNSAGGTPDPSNLYLFAFTIYQPITVNNLYLFNGSNNPLLKIAPANFKVDYNKIMVLKTAVPSGSNFLSISIDYTHNPVYHVIDFNRDSIKQKDGVSMDAQRVYYPINSIGRRAHFVLDNPNYDSNSVIDNTQYT